MYYSYHFGRVFKRYVVLAVALLMVISAIVVFAPQSNPGGAKGTGSHFKYTPFAPPSGIYPVYVANGKQSSFTNMGWASASLNFEVNLLNTKGPNGTPYSTSPVEMLFSHSGQYGFVLSNNTSRQLIIDNIIANANEPVANLTISGAGRAIAEFLSPNGTELWAQFANELVTVNVTTPSNPVVIHQYASSTYGRMIGIYPSGNYVLMARNNGSNYTISRNSTTLSASTVTYKEAAGYEPVAASFSDAGKWMYLVEENGSRSPEGYVLGINATTLVSKTSYSTAGIPTAMGISSATSYLYVSLFGNPISKVDVLNVTTNTSLTLKTTVNVGSGASSIAVTDRGLQVYVLNDLSDNVSVISAPSNTHVKTFSSLPTGYHGMMTAAPEVFPVSFTAKGLRAGVTWTEYVNGTGGLGAGYERGTSPGSAVYYLPNGTYSYFTTAATGYKVVANGSGVFQVNGFGVAIFPEFYDQVIFTETGLPVGASWFVNLTSGNTSSSNLSQISFYLPLKNTNYTVELSNKNYRASPFSGILDVASTSAISITINPILYDVNITESGLPSGWYTSGWYINITGHSLGYTTTHWDNYTKQFLNGTYSYNAYDANHTYKKTGNFTVHGSNFTLVVKFAPVLYHVIFNETGLPSGVSWGINIRGNINSSTGPNQTLSLINGSYSYSISSQNLSYHATGGTFTISGNTVYENVVFSKVLYLVTVNQKNLPIGYRWYFNTTSGITVMSTVNYLTFETTNGSYSYSIQSADKTYRGTHGTFKVKGNAVTLTYTFTRVKYNLTFSESGLPTGQSWSVFLGTGQYKSSSSSSLIFSLTNGTYLYKASSVSPYSNPGGSASISGNSVSIALVFEKVTYSVNFSERGLPAGFEWGVNISGGQSVVGSTGSVLISLSNGTYSYHVVSYNKTYMPTSNVSGTFTVKGSALTFSVSFMQVLYKFVFKETGLSSGKTWTVEINGHVYSTNNTSLTVMLSNGTYSVTASGPSGYNSNMTSHSLHVSGSGKTVNVGFSKVSDLGYLYVIVGVIIAAIVLIGIIYYFKIKK